MDTIAYYRALSVLFYGQHLAMPNILVSRTILQGADSAMLDPQISRGVHDEATMEKLLVKGGSSTNDLRQWEIEHFLELEMHLGDFASEGLRTLVLGMKVLGEEELTAWLDTFKHAASSMKDRDELLNAAAIELERDLCIVGATAIEDKLQKNVPKTISKLAEAGIKMWVLTGDKRATAVEIGYSTAGKIGRLSIYRRYILVCCIFLTFFFCLVCLVLTPKMHVTQVPDEGADKVRTQLAMEFMKLVKIGTLWKYQRATLQDANSRFSFENFIFRTAKFKRRFSRFLRKCWVLLLMTVRLLHREQAAEYFLGLARERENEERIVQPNQLRRNVRQRAETILKDFLEKRNSSLPTSSSCNRHSQDHPSVPLSEQEQSTRGLDDVPKVFNRAGMSKAVLFDVKAEHNQSKAINIGMDGIVEIQHLEDEYEEALLVDEDCLEEISVAPTAEHPDLDKMKRSTLERVFAVDKHARQGKLRKHLKSSRFREFFQGGSLPLEAEGTSPSTKGSRALVIEGAALKHMFGDAELEQLLFAVASHCDAVIACRVSPKQKAELVRLVRQNVVPEPGTLAIGDGANDVGMIQEAHVGVGISGKEGQQAVNASDFAISQFRFLEDLVLIHGRWNFFRMSTVVLFQFYKNAW